MFKYDIKPNVQRVEVCLDNRPVSLPEGMNLAAALLATGEIISRISPSTRKPCSPHCLMGVCYECLMEIDGVTRQACKTKIKQGMKIKRSLSPVSKTFTGKEGNP